MKVITTEVYKKYVVGQKIEPRDAVKEPVDNLPIIREEDLSTILEDDLELGTEAFPEGAPAVEEVEESPGVPQERPVFSNKYDVIDWAEKNKDVIEINYTTKHGTNMTRVVEPHGTFYANTTHRTILVAFDRTVGAIRAFIVRNINGLDFTDQKFNKRFIVMAR